MQEKGVFPAPFSQLFQIHGNIFKPDPSRYSGQTSVMCISHGVLPHFVYRFATFSFAQLLHDIQIFLPYVFMNNLCPFSLATHFALYGQSTHSLGLLR